MDDYEVVLRIYIQIRFIVRSSLSRMIVDRRVEDWCEMTVQEHKSSLRTSSPEDPEDPESTKSSSSSSTTSSQDSENLLGRVLAGESWCHNQSTTSIT